MKIFLIETNKFPLQLIIANSEAEALKKYASEYGFDNKDDLIDTCEKFYGFVQDKNNCLKVTNIFH